MLVGALPLWVMKLTYYEINPTLWISCQLGLFLIYFGFTFSSALLVIISVEKCFALYFPFKSKTICTVRTAKRVSSLTTLIYAAFFSQIFYFSNRRVWYCDFFWPSYVYKEIFSNIVATLYTCVPFAVMISANVAIIYKFIKAKLKSNQDGTESTEKALSKSATRGIVMLLTVSFAFIILTGPISFFHITIFPNVSVLTYDIFVILQYINHGINGFLYCATGTRFRNEVKNTLSCSSKNRLIS